MVQNLKAFQVEGKAGKLRLSSVILAPDKVKAERIMTRRLTSHVGFCKSAYVDVRAVGKDEK